MLQGEPDIENQANTDTNNAPMTQDDVGRLYLTIAAMCLVNSLISLNCGYKIHQYIVFNTICYMIFAVYVVRKRMNIETFTCFYSIACVCVFVIVMIARWASDSCINTCPKCQECGTPVPTPVGTPVPTLN